MATPGHCHHSLHLVASYCLPDLSPRFVCLNTMNCTNGDNGAPFRSASSQRLSVCYTQLCTGKVTKNEKREVKREVQTLPTFIPLLICRVKWP